MMRTPKDADCADGVQGIHQAGLLHHQNGTGIVIGHGATDTDAFVLFAHAGQAQIGVARDRPEQPVAGNDIGQCDNFADTGPLDQSDDPGTGRVGNGLCLRSLHIDHLRPSFRNRVMTRTTARRSSGRPIVMRI